MGDERSDGPRDYGVGRVFQRGRRWWIAFCHNGKEVRESAGDNERSARRLLRKRVGEIHAGQFTGALEKRLTVGDLLDALETHLRNKGAKSASHGYHIRAVRKRFGLLKALEIDGARIERFISEELAAEHPKAHATINREIGTLRQAFHLARKQGRLSRVPYFPRLREDNVRQGFFEADHVERLLESLPDYLVDVARFAYLTGWRIGEIRSLGWENVDRAAGEIRLSAAKGDRGERRGRLLALDDELRALIERRWQAREVDQSTRRRPVRETFLSPYVFHYRGKPLGDFRKSWATACEAAGCPGKLFHDFRRTAVRNMTRAGVPQSVAMSISGHRTQSMFHRYNVSSEADQREALRRVREHLEEQPKQRADVVELRPGGR